MLSWSISRCCLASRGTASIAMDFAYCQGFRNFGVCIFCCVPNKWVWNSCMGKKVVSPFPCFLPKECLILPLSRSFFVSLSTHMCSKFPPCGTNTEMSSWQFTYSGGVTAVSSAVQLWCSLQTIRTPCATLCAWGFPTNLLRNVYRSKAGAPCHLLCRINCRLNYSSVKSN